VTCRNRFSSSPQKKSFEARAGEAYIGRALNREESEMLSRMLRALRRIGEIMWPQRPLPTTPLDDPRYRR
jgi:hypothetical protein